MPTAGAGFNSQLLTEGMEMSEINEKLELIKAIQNSSTETAAQINALAAKGFYVEGMAAATLSIFALATFVLGVLILLVGIHRDNEGATAAGGGLALISFFVLLVSSSIAIPYMLAPESQLVLELAR